MGKHRPRLLVLDGPLVPGEEVARALADKYDIAVVSGSPPAAHEGGGGVPEAIATGGFQVVFGDAGQLTESGQLSQGEASAMLGAIGEGICLAASDGQIVWANSRFRQLDPQTHARIGAICRRAAIRFNEQACVLAPGGEIHPMRMDVGTPDESKYYEIVVSAVPGAFDSGAAGSAGGPSADSTGAGAERREASGTVRPKVDAGAGAIQRVAVVVWDVTQMRRREQKMAAIDRAGAEIVRLDVEQIRKMHVVERLKLLEEKIVKVSHDLLHFDHLAIRLINKRTGKLELVIASGLAPEAMEVSLMAKREGNGIMGYVAATGESYLCPDVTMDPKYVVGIENARSSLTVPLRLNDQVIGAFNVESEKVGAFTDEDRQFAEMFSNSIALALHILDLLVVERCETGASVTDTVEDELSEPLTDILKEADWLKSAAAALASSSTAGTPGVDPKLREHIDRIVSDVEAIRRRVREAAEGPQHILGAEKGLVDVAVDPGLAGKRVLVADDEPKIRQTIREALRGRGCTVVVCESGEAAIEALEHMAAAAASPYSAAESGFDLLISDIRMPDKNGYEVFSAARRLIPGIPAILMTGFGYDPHHSIVRASQEGLQCVLFKPFQLERLLEEVRKALGVPPLA
ncbi:MAG: response regulator [Phycisphaerales bacterium]